MNLAKATVTLGLAVLAVAAGPLAAADAAGWYGGLSLGLSKAPIDDARITSGLAVQGFATTSISDDERDIGYKILGGYRFNRYLALEGGYFDLGKFGFTATTVPAGTLTGNIKVRGLNLDAVGILPITERFSAFGRVGLTYADVRGADTGTGAVTVLDPNPRKRDPNYKVGVGIQYDVTESLGLRAEAERYRIKDAVGNKGDVDLYSAGLIYRFGGKTPAPTPRAAAPEVVAAAPAPQVAVTPPPPEPKAPPAPAPQAPTRVTYSVDILFDFNKAVLKPAGREALDKFAADLRGATYDVITSTGHTDRLGPPEYNMQLSTRRAEAVRAYLVQVAGIPAGRITARGAGETEPVTKPGECIGEKRTPQLIACLQPDRRDRVAVEVSATR